MDWKGRLLPSFRSCEGVPAEITVEAVPTGPGDLLTSQSHIQAEENRGPLREPSPRRLRQKRSVVRFESTTKHPGPSRHADRLAWLIVDRPPLPIPEVTQRDPESPTARSGERDLLRELGDL